MSEVLAAGASSGSDASCSASRAAAAAGSSPSCTSSGTVVAFLPRKSCKRRRHGTVTETHVQVHRLSVCKG